LGHPHHDHHPHPHRHHHEHQHGQHRQPHIINIITNGVSTSRIITTIFGDRRHQHHHHLCINVVIAINIISILMVSTIKLAPKIS